MKLRYRVKILWKQICENNNAKKWIFQVLRSWNLKKPEVFFQKADLYIKQTWQPLIARTWRAINILFRIVDKCGWNQNILYRAIYAHLHKRKLPLLDTLDALDFFFNIKRKLSHFISWSYNSELRFNYVPFPDILEEDW